jgi:2-oxoisovalerate dehydrogenase E1 component
VDVGSVVPVPLGRARVVQEGADVTIVSWGNCLELALEASAAADVSVEIIDLRTVVPCDYETITRSVAKTGRMIVVHEDNITCGFGQAILAEMTRVPERFNLFLSPPQLVARPDVQIGYNPVYEYAALPSTQQVLDAIGIVME